MNNLWSHSWDVILEEFHKCDLLCLNCHAIVEDEIESKNPNNYRRKK